MLPSKHHSSLRIFVQSAVPCPVPTSDLGPGSNPMRVKTWDVELINPV